MAQSKPQGLTNDGAALSTGLAERNWVWNSRPRSIMAPDWKQKEHSNIGQGGLLVLWPGAKKRKTSWKSQGYSLESKNQESWIRYEQRINIMASEKVNSHLLDILYAFFDSQVEGVTKCYLYIPLLGLSPEVCVITTLRVWQEPYVKLHACMSERVWERAWVCIHMCGSYSFLTGRDLAKCAAHRNWIWVKTREWWVTSQACSGHTSLLWSSLWGIKK